MTAPVTPPAAPFAPLAIVGIGCMFPRAMDVTEYWANIRHAVDAIGDIPATHWRPDDYFDADPAAPDMTYARRGGFLSPVDFDPLRYGISPHNLEATDTTHLLGLVVAEQALRDAGYATSKDGADGKTFDRDRAAVILGVTGALELVIPLGARLGHPQWRRAMLAAGIEEQAIADVLGRMAESYVPWQENSFPGLLGNVAAGRITNRFDLGGTNCVVDAACASSLSAVHMAAMELHSGKADLVLTGGLDTFNDIFMYMCFSKTPALSPTGDSRPFSATGDGTILGEGLGIVVLKRLADAERDGDRIYCVLRGLGSSSDGRGNAVYAPSAAGQQKALRAAYQAAQVSPATIELVEAHGTGTRVGDAVEADALRQVYHEAQAEGTWCAVGSVKSMIGHTKAAAGVAGMIKAALALHDKVLPPSIKVPEPLPQLAPGTGPLYVNTQARPWLPSADHPRRAGLSAFGFGGSNFHCVLEEHRREKPAPVWDGETLLFAWSGATVDEIRRQMAGVTETDWPALRVAAAKSRERFRTGAMYRAACVVERHGPPFAAVAERVVQGLAKVDAERFVATPDGFVGTGPAGKLAVLFPGQGSQYGGMLRELACQWPEMLQSLATANDVGSVQPIGERLSDRVYPVPAFADDTRAAQEAALAVTDVAQPALGAVSLGAWRVLQQFGVRADFAAGHSFGELTALAAAGWIDAGTFHRLAAERGRLMAASAPAGGDRGAMLAVAATVDDVRRLIADERLDIVIANHNAPRQVVLSGATTAIEQTAAACAARKITARRLPVAAAFHSRFVAGAEAEFAAALANVAITPTACNVYANTTAATYPTSITDARQLLAGQLARPVEFVREIERLAADGATTFLEVGPKSVLTGLVRSILADRPHHALALDASQGKRRGEFDLACVVAQLAALGCAVDLTPWDAPATRLAAQPPAKKPVLTIPLCGANYVKTRPERPPTARPASSPSSSSSLAPSAPSRESMPVEPPRPATTPSIAASPVAADALAAALRATEQSILALERLQEQTAQLQRQYLDGQQTAQRTVQQLVDQQQWLIGTALGVPVAPPFAAAPYAAAPLAAPVAPLPPVAPEVTPAPVAAPVAPAPALVRRIDVAEPTPAPHFEVVAPAAAPPAPADDLARVLLEVVAEKTGYPAEMLELDMRLDADLGIDSIKRVEILSALQERLPEAPAVKPDDLGTFHTLRQVVEFLAPATIPVAVAMTVAPVSSAPAIDVAGDLLAVVAEKTGYPAEMLELSMRLDADLGIDSIKRVEILSALQERFPELPAVRPDDLGTFQTLGEIVTFMQGSVAVAPVITPATTPAARVTEVHAPAAVVVPLEPLLHLAVQLEPLAAPAQRKPLPWPAGGTMYVTDDGAGLSAAIVDALGRRGIAARLVSLQAEIADAIFAGLVIVAPPQPAESFPADVLLTLQRARRALQTAAESGVALLAGVTRLGGAFGLNDTAPDAPLTAALAGIIKTARHEWPTVVCKVIDVSAAPDVEDLVDELLHAGPIEVGLRAGQRWRIALRDTAPDADAALDADTAPVFSPGDVIVISGGARGITAESAVQLARRYRCRLLLLGRTPEPEAEPAWLAGLQDESALKRAILGQYQGDISPRTLDVYYRQVLAGREVAATLERIRAAGGTAWYRSVDVRDAAAVAEILAAARSELGPVRGVVHAAGVLADRRIEDQTPPQFAEVFSIKVAGAQALLAATAEDDLRAIAFFSSSTARFGRAGQIAYAAANETLNKLAQTERTRRPQCRVVSLNWGPWDGGMVTPALRELFAAEGIGVIPLAAGAELLLQALAAPLDGPVETVVLGPGSRVPRDDEWSPPLTAPPLAFTLPVHPLDPVAAEADAAAQDSGLHVAFERMIDIDTLPVLRSHVINHRAVVPLALLVEWLGHAAMHDNPGLVPIGIDDLRVFKGIILEPDETRTIRVLAGRPEPTPEGDRVIAEIRNGMTLHARASVLLAARYSPTTATVRLPEVRPYPRTADEVYAGDLLFHGPDLQGIVDVEGCSDEGMLGRARAAPQPAAWIDQPLRASWLADPLALDVAFQLMILWSFERRGAGSLPTRLGKYRQFRRTFPATGTWVVIRVTKAADHAATADIEFLDDTNQLVARIEGYECVIDTTLQAAFARNQLLQTARA